MVSRHESRGCRKQSGRARGRPASKVRRSRTKKQRHRSDHTTQTVHRWAPQRDRYRAVPLPFWNAFFQRLPELTTWNETLLSNRQYKEILEKKLSDLFKPPGPPRPPQNAHRHTPEIFKVDLNTLKTSHYELFRTRPTGGPLLQNSR